MNSKTNTELFFRFGDVLQAVKMFMVYISTFLRSSAYLIGIVFGYFIDKFETQKRQQMHENDEFISKKGLIYIFIFFTHWIFLPIIIKISVEFFWYHSVIFAIDAVSKLTLSISVGLFIIVCHFWNFKIGETDSEWPWISMMIKFVNEILSLKIWRPIAKLSYVFYLVHPSIQLNIAASSEEYVKLDIFTMVNKDIYPNHEI